ncbi:MAG: RidA family protein [Egibacteraceae bacterium]
MNETETEAGLPPTAGYRYADQVGHQLFVAGQVPLDAQGELVGHDDPAAQARRCLDNLALLLGAYQFSVEDVRHVRVHVVGPHDALTATWAAVRSWFEDDVPPATLLGGPQLGYRGQLVEIEATIQRDP